MNYQETMVENFINRVFSFYPGLAGEYGIIIDSLGDYSLDSINGFLADLKEYRDYFNSEYYQNFLIIKRINMLIQEIEDEDYARYTGFYYSRAFLTLLESLSITDSSEKNLELFLKRLDYLDMIVSQAYSNIKDEYLSKIEIINTKKSFDRTCNLIETKAKEYLDERYFDAKNKFQFFLESKLAIAGNKIGNTKTLRYYQNIENTCDGILSTDDIYKNLMELAEHLNFLWQTLKNEADDFIDIEFDSDSIIDWVIYIKALFKDLNGMAEDIDEYRIFNKSYENNTQSCRASLKFYDQDVLLSINNREINSNEKKLEIMIHEVMPGHFFMSRYYSGRTNYIFKERSFWEGWALMCEYYSITRCDCNLYKKTVSKQLLNNVLVGITSIKYWYHKSKREDIFNWLQSTFSLSAEETNSILITAIIDSEQKMDYFVGFAAYYHLYKAVGFDVLTDMTMHSGASFYHLREHIG